MGDVKGDVGRCCFLGDLKSMQAHEYKSELHIIVHRPVDVGDVYRKASNITKVAMWTMLSPTGQRRIASAARLGVVT